MNVLIVHAHHEPKSYCSALAEQARESLEAAGHSVVVSDLSAMGFDPVSDRRNFVGAKDPDYLKQQVEETHASEEGTFAPELVEEIEKLERADLLICSFPLWWFGMPALLKGWVDRVFAMGRVYGGGKWYENGIGGGDARALVLMTTGGPESMYSGRGLNPPLETLLTPIHHGIFWFNGFCPLDPFIAWSPARMSQEERTARLGELDDRLAGIFEEAPRSLPPASEFGRDFSDTKARFHVVLGGEAVATEGARLQEWWRASRVTDLYRGESGRLFLTFRASDRAEVEDAVSSLEGRSVESIEKVEMT